MSLYSNRVLSYVLAGLLELGLREVMEVDVVSIPWCSTCVCGEHTCPVFYVGVFCIILLLWVPVVRKCMGRCAFSRASIYSNVSPPCFQAEL